MKQYVVRSLEEIAQGVRLIPDVHFGIFEATAEGNVIAFCRTLADAEHIARLLNAEEWKNAGRQ